MRYFMTRNLVDASVMSRRILYFTYSIHSWTRLPLSSINRSQCFFSTSVISDLQDLSYIKVWWSMYFWPTRYPFEVILQVSQRITDFDDIYICVGHYPNKTPYPKNLDQILYLKRLDNSVYGHNVNSIVKTYIWIVIWSHFSSRYPSPCSCRVHFLWFIFL